MKNILTIEIKDNKTVVTLTKLIGLNHNLLLHKSYDSKPLNKSTYYDYSIIKNIKKDLREIGMYDLIDEITLTINTKQVAIETFYREIKYNTDIKLEKQKMKLKLKSKYPDLKLLTIIYSNDDKSLTKKNISITVELVKKEYLNNIMEQYKLEGMKFTKIIPLLKVIRNATKKQEIKNGVTFSILVEEKFTQLTSFKDGTIFSSKKWNLGLTNIYDYISEQMQVDKSSAKTFFNSYGSIPPEDVIDDKIIHSIKYGREIVIFTKKDLSRFIIEKINELFSNVKFEVDPIRENQKIRIIFNGEIKSLIGFIKYASKSFAEDNIRRFKSSMIGLSDKTEFITDGILNSVNETFFNNKEEINIPKINAFSKIIKMYNYI